LAHVDSLRISRNRPTPSADGHQSDLLIEASVAMPAAGDVRLLVQLGRREVASGVEPTVGPGAGGARLALVMAFAPDVVLRNGVKPAQGDKPYGRRPKPGVTPRAGNPIVPPSLKSGASARHDDVS
jgi:hypothetical protein